MSGSRDPVGAHRNSTGSAVPKDELPTPAMTAYAFPRGPGVGVPGVIATKLAAQSSRRDVSMRVRMPRSP